MALLNRNVARFVHKHPDRIHLWMWFMINFSYNLCLFKREVRRRTAFKWLQSMFAMAYLLNCTQWAFNNIALSV